VLALRCFVNTIQDTLEAPPGGGADAAGGLVSDITGGRSDVRDRLTFVVLAQGPLVGVLAVLTWMLSMTDPVRVVHPAYLAGATLAVAASAVAFSWVRSESIGQWMSVVPLADIVVIGLVRSALHTGPGTAPALGSLLLFPVLWLSVELGRRALPFVLAGSLAVVGIPYLAAGARPQTSVDWLNAALLPLTLVSISLATGWVVRRIREGRRRSEELAERLRISLAEAADREATLLSVTDTVDAAILMLDEDGNVILSNGTARSLYSTANIRDDGSVRPEQLLYREDRTSLVPTDDNILNRALRGDSLLGRVYWAGPPGNQHALSAVSRSVVRPDGKVLGTVVVSHDVTRLMESIEVRDAFLATVSHELTTPLTNIIGYLDLVESDTNSAEIGVIRNNAERLHRLVGDLLHSGGSARVTRMPGDVAAIAAAALSDIHPTAASAGIALRQTGLATLSADVDGGGIQRVLANLLSNALKYSDPGTTVVVDVGAADGMAVIAVTDMGIGIDAVDLERVFDKFFRAPRSRSEAVPGTGLGLSIAKALVDAHEGRLEVASEPGLGTTFTVLIPLSSAPH
jgi:two-component system phosphate regulon sensor histidine kinase PhoR